LAMATSAAASLPAESKALADSGISGVIPTDWAL